MSDVTSNKVEYGLSELYIASYTATYDPGEDKWELTYGTPVLLPGAVSFESDDDVNELTFYADNKIYHVEKAAVSKTATLTVAKFPDSFKTGYLGYTTTTDGAKALRIGQKPLPFVLMFTGDGDVHKTRHIYYNCKSGPIKRGYTTTAENKTIETESVELTIAGADDTRIIHVAYTSSHDDYDDLTGAIPVEEFPAAP